jgi:hypothetical protein
MTGPIIFSPYFRKSTTEHFVVTSRFFEQPFMTCISGKKQVLPAEETVQVREYHLAGVGETEEEEEEEIKGYSEDRVRSIVNIVDNIVPFPHVKHKEEEEIFAGARFAGRDQVLEPDPKRVRRMIPPYVEQPDDDQLKRVLEWTDTLNQAKDEVGESAIMNFLNLLAANLAVDVQDLIARDPRWNLPHSKDPDDIPSSAVQRKHLAPVSGVGTRPMSDLELENYVRIPYVGGQVEMHNFPKGACVTCADDLKRRYPNLYEGANVSDFYESEESCVPFAMMVSAWMASKQIQRSGRSNFAKASVGPSRDYKNAMLIFGKMWYDPVRGCVCKRSSRFC